MGPETIAHYYSNQFQSRQDPLWENNLEKTDIGHSLHGLLFTPQAVWYPVRKSQLMIERVLENQLATLETAIRELCQSDKVLRENVELLCSIPGVAELTAVRMLAYGRVAHLPGGFLLPL